jgi:guanylate kinase
VKKPRRPLAARQGSFFVVAGPSGSGKTTLISAIRERLPELAYSPSYTSRALRSGEMPSKNYHFISRSQFEEKIQRDEFLEWALFNSNYYGTAKQEVQHYLKQGQSVIKEIDVQGMRQLDKKRRAVGGRLISLFILPPSLKELEKRLTGRGTEKRAMQQQRLKTAFEELKHVELFDYLIVNREQERAVETILQIIDWNASQK